MFFKVLWRLYRKDNTHKRCCVARNCVCNEIGGRTDQPRGIFDEVCGNVSDVQRTFSLQVFLAAQR